MLRDLTICLVASLIVFATVELYKWVRRRLHTGVRQDIVVETT